MSGSDNESDSGSRASPWNEDRRRDRRVDLGTSVTIWIRDTDGATGGTAGLSESAEFTVEGQGEDISVGGMYLVADDRIPAGASVEVEFEIPEVDEEFDLRAEVRWTRRQAESGDAVRWGVGLEFQDLDDDRREALDEVVLASLTE